MDATGRSGEGRLMISEALFLISYLILLPIAVMFPFAGALAYEWLQYMPPEVVYNAGAFSNMSLIMGGIALGLGLVRDRKQKPQPMWLLVIFVTYALWCAVTQATSLVGDMGKLQWDRSWKMLAFTIVMSTMFRTRQRIEAFIWVICLAIGNFVVAGAIKTILSGGGGETVVGAAGNQLGERVFFAVAITTMIPLVRYLRDYGTIFKHTRYYRIAMDGMTAACVIATVGTQARTGLVALSVLGFFYFLKAKKKALFILVIPLVAGLIYFVAPAGYFERMNTIGDATESSSAGRIDAWIWGWKFALEHPITGGGFHSYTLHQVGTIEHPAFLEAHNFFMESLGDHGFVGLFLVIGVTIGTIINCQRMSKRARGVEGLEWAVYLGTMLQLAMWTFLAGSEFVANATYSTPFELTALSLGARAIVERRLAEEKPKSPAFGTPASPSMSAPSNVIPALTRGKLQTAHRQTIGVAT
jgi:probable O-glycosylation ligase (exosortase A-associated)